MRDPRVLPARPAPRAASRAAPRAASRAALAPGGANARPGEANPNAKVTEATVRAWRAEAARVVRARLRETGGRNAKTGAPLSSLLRQTGLFARLARAHERPVSVAAVCMAVYGDTWADVPGALPRSVARTAALGGRASGRPPAGPAVRNRRGHGART